MATAAETLTFPTGALGEKKKINKTGTEEWECVEYIQILIYLPEWRLSRSQKAVNNRPKNSL